MSGIAAICNANGEPISEDTLFSLASTLEKRGPDKQQFWRNESTALIHTLLASTYEAVAENQPSTLSGSFWISADARIDGREQLLDQLKGAGYKLDNPTDDMLILYAYRCWGESCLDYLIGDFAFALWDAENQQLFCATDHFGVVPLYYAWNGCTLVVSNTLNTVRLHPSVNDELDEAVLGDYLLFRFNEYAEKTTFKQINRLSGSHSLTLKKGQLSVKRYWQIERRSVQYFRNESEYVDQFRELLETAVSDRLRQDSVASHLSGGMDSSSISAIANRLQLEKGGKLETYTFGQRAGVKDQESPIAIELARHLGLKHHVAQMPVHEGLIGDVPSGLCAPEPSWLRLDCLQRNVMQEVCGYSRVLLTGYGGDPLLHGTPLSPKELLRPNSILGTVINYARHIHIFKRRPALGLRKNHKALEPRPIPNWIAPSFVKNGNLSERQKQRYFNISRDYNHQAGMCQDAMWRRLFSWNDPGFTHLPIKIRHPFFDVRLLKYTYSLPPFPWLEKKYLLRSAMSDILPPVVNSRPKTTLSENIFTSFLKQQRSVDHLESLLINEKISPYIDSNNVMHIIRNPESYKMHQVREVKRALTLAVWLRHYQEKTDDPLSSQGLREVTHL